MVEGVDDNPQILVANAFKARAALKDPQKLGLQNIANIERLFYLILRGEVIVFS